MSDDELKPYRELLDHALAAQSVNGRATVELTPDAYRKLLGEVVRLRDALARMATDPQSAAAV